MIQHPTEPAVTTLTPAVSQPVEPSLTAHDCISHRGDGCRGAVEYRMPLSGSGVPFPRCDKGWDERLRLEDELRQRYPDQAPSDFDPAYAGESWDDDY